MTDTLTIRLDEALARALNEESQHTGLSKGQIAREALESRLRSRSRIKVMGRYFGTTHGPSDLSSNKTYRRNWKARRP